MRRLVFILTIWSFAQAEVYREKEDFAYSRSSSDDGSKSGYYGAQRGNMGGNYERSHNMDSLAQHQMSGLVRQVEGELGDTSKTRTGTVYSAASSRGMYGSGNYDLSNLEGRSFSEGIHYDDSQSQHSLSQSQHSGGRSAQSSQSISQNSEFINSRSDSSRYNRFLQEGQAIQSDDQSTVNSDREQYGYHSGADSSRYFQQVGQSDHSGYRDNTQLSESYYDSNGHLRTRLIGSPQSKIIIRPGTRVTVPVAAHIYNTADTQETAQNSALHSQRSEAASLSNNNHQIDYSSSGSPRYYQSSSSYRKEWEKHDSSPVPVPLAVPNIPQHSELYEDTQNAQQLHSYGSNSQSSRSSYGYGGYNAIAHSSSSDLSQDQTEQNAQHQKSGAAYRLDGSSSSTGRFGNLIGETDSRPKSYQSSYSYHKSWERQGDPYTIIPSTSVGADHTSQRLTSAYDRSGQSSSRFSQGCNVECDQSGHLRVSRAIDHEKSGIFHTGQDMDQKELSNFEDFGQQIQSGWDQVEDLGQQQQNSWDVFSQQSKWDDMGQEPQNSWADLGQQPQNKWEDFGQQTQNKWDDFGQQTQNKWEDFGQQTQTEDDSIDIQHQSQSGNLEDFGQQTQSKRDEIEKSVQEYKTLEKVQNMQPQTETVEQETQKKHFENLGEIEKNYKDSESQQLQNKWEDLNQNPQTNWGNFGQQTETEDELTNFQHQNQDQNENLEDFGQQTQSQWGDKLEKPLQKVLQNPQQQIQILEQNKRSENRGEIEKKDKDYIDNQQLQSKWENLDQIPQTKFDFGQQTETDEKLTNFQHQGQDQNVISIEDLGQETQSKRDQNDTFVSKRKESVDYSQSSQQKIQGFDEQTQQNLNLGQISNNHQANNENLSEQSVNDKHDQQSAGSYNFQSYKERQSSQQLLKDWDNLHKNHNLQDKIFSSDQQTQSKWDEAEDIGQQTQGKWDQFQDIGQQEHHNWDELLKKSPERITKDYSQQTQQVITTWEDMKNTNDQLKPVWEQNQENTLNSHEHQLHDSTDKWQTISHTGENHKQNDSNGLKNIWDIMDSFEQQLDHTEQTKQSHVQNFNTDQQKEANNFEQEPYHQDKYQSNNQPHTSTPEDNHNVDKTHVNTLSLPYGIGRGDISEIEDTSFSTTTIKITLGQNINDYQLLVTETPKTLQEIEVSRMHNTLVKNLNRTNEEQKADEALSVLSLETSRYHEKEHELNYGPVPIKPIVTSEAREKEQSQDSDKTRSQEIPEQAPEDIGQKSDLGLKPELENVEQQVQSTWGNIEDTQNINENIWKNLAQARDTWDKTDDYGQQSQVVVWNKDNLEQKTFNPDDFRQEIQTLRQPSEAQEKNEYFESYNKHRNFPTDFNEKNHPQNSNVNEDALSQKVQSLKDIPYNIVPDVPTTTEAVTEKPGFWKNVGNKLSNAKDKVYSWFSRS